MLDVKILKTHHSGTDEARKLLPFIKEADVFSPEDALRTDEEAITDELKWVRLLSSGVSRSRFIREKLPEIVTTKESQDLAYCTKQFDYLFLSGIPIYYLERFKKSEIAMMKEIFDPRIKNRNLALDALEDRDVEGFCRLYLEYLGDFAKSANLRDREVARNLDSCEPTIRARFPNLSGRDPLRLVVAMGGVHAPERHTSVPVRCYQLFSERDNESQAISILMQGQDYEEATLYALRSGAEFLSRGELIEIDIKTINTLSRPELVSLISNR